MKWNSRPLALAALGTLLMAMNAVAATPPIGSETRPLQFTKTITSAAVDMDGVTPVNEPPVALNDEATTTEDTPLDIPVLANDSDPEGHQLTIVWPLVFCVQIVGYDCPIGYLPPANFCGTDYFSYTVSDGESSATAIVTVTVSCAPDDPTDIALSAPSLPEGQAAGALVGTLSTSDPDTGDTFTYSLVAGDTSAFSIDGSQVRAAAVFDYETKNSYGITVRSTDQTGRWVEKEFTIAVTDVSAPAATTLPVASVSTSGANLSGEVNPHGVASTAWFEWGTDPALADSTPTASIDGGDGTSPLSVSIALSDLSPGVTYYYRVVAQSEEGITRAGIDYFAPEPDDTWSIVVNCSADVESPPPGKMTLREAVSRVAGGGTITFDQRLDGGRIDLTIVGEANSILSGEVFTMNAGKWEFQGYQERNYGKSALYADKSLAIDASSLPGGITLAWAGGDASHARVLAVFGDLTMFNVTVTSGYAGNDPLPGNTAQPYTLARGGAIAVWGTARLEDCVLSGNRAVGDTSPSRDRGTFGGGIYADTVDLTGCIVSGNSVTGFGAAGGGVYSVGGAESWVNSSLRRTAVTGNRVTAQHAYGGGVYSDGGGPGSMMTLEIDTCTIARNAVEDHPGINQSAMFQYYYRGGGVYMSNGILTVAGSTIVENAVSGASAIFSGKSNMGGGGIAATIGDAHVVESMDLRHSIIAGNTLAGVPSDVFTGSLIDFYSSGYNLIGDIDFSPMLVPVPYWLCVSRRHYPKAGDQDAVAVGDALDLGNVRRHGTITSVGTDAGNKAVLWYPPRGIAIERIPAEEYWVPIVKVGYDYVDWENPVDDFPSLVLEKLRTWQGGVLGPDFGKDLGDLSAVVWYPEAYTWPSDPRNGPWIAFWRNVDAEIGDRLGSVGPGEDFWGSFENGPLGENIVMTVMSYDNGPYSRGLTDQNGTSRDAAGWADVGAVETGKLFSFSGSPVVENHPAGIEAGTLSPVDSEAGVDLTYTLVGGAGSEDNASFSISGDRVLTAAPLNFEPRGACTIRVRAVGTGVAATERVFTIAVVDVDEAPVGVSDSYALADGGTLNVDAPGVLENDADPEGEALSVDLVDAPTHGTLTVNADGSFVYEHDGSASTGDSFTYRVSDASASSGPITVTIAVRPVNDAPSFVRGADQTVVEDAGAQTVPGWATGINAGPAGEDGQTLNFILTTDNEALFALQPAISPSGALTYTTATDANGSATVTVRLRDDGGTADGGQDMSAAEIFTITVTPVNDAPTAHEDGFAVAEGGTLSEAAPGVLGNDTDAEAGTLAALQLTSPAHGTLILHADGSFTYTHDGSETLTDSFTYAANDGTTNSLAATVTITVSPVNEPPTAVALSGRAVAEHQAKGTVVGTLGSADPDAGDTFAYTLVSGAGSTDNASFRIEGDALVTDAIFNFKGKSSLSIRVRTTDQGLLSAENAFAISVTDVREAKNDFDGDGRSDIGCYYPPGGNWYGFDSGNGFWQTQFGYAGTLPVSGDFDGDGASDIGCYYPGGGNWYVTKSAAGFATFQFGYAGTIPIVGDFDGDGQDDIGCYYPPGGNWYVMKSTKGFATFQFGYAGTIPIVGDFDGDGTSDFGCYYPPSGNWYVMKSKEGFATFQFGYAGTIPIVGDFDGDGKDDIGCYYPPGGNWYVMQSTKGFWQTQFGYAGTEPVVGDFDGDGKSDLGCYYPAGGNWYVMKSKEGFWQTQFGYGGTIPLGGTLR